MSASPFFEPIGGWELDEDQGTAAINIAAGPDLVLANGATFASEAGRFGGAGSFDGFRSISTAGDNYDPLGNNQSFALWFKRPQGGAIGGDQYLLSKGNRYSTREGFSMNISESTQEIRLRVNSSDSTAERASTEVDLPQDDLWHHLAMVIDHDAGRVKGYLDGSAAGWRSGGGGPSSSSLSSITSIDTDDAFTVGAVRDSGNTYDNFNGLIDDVRIYGGAITAAQAYDLANPPQLGEGLLAHYRANEPGGTVAADRVAGNDFALLNGATLAPAGGIEGGALTFDGIDDRADAGDVLDIGAGDFTASVWFKRPQGGAAGSDQVLVSKGNRYSTRAGWSISLSDATQELRFRVNSSDDTSGRASTEVDLPQDDDWHHLLVTVDRGQNKVRGWIDGESASWRSGGGGPSSRSLSSVGSIVTDDPFTLGGVRDGAGFHSAFRGQLDEIRLYDRVLSTSEIAALLTPAADEPTTVYLAGADEVEAFLDHTITLGVRNPGTSPITSWTIDWGDGTVETLTGSPTTATHAYATPRRTGYAITATATDGTETFTTEAALAVLATPSRTVDSDSDDLVDFDEEVWATDPTNPDTDGDLFLDGFEAARYNAFTEYWNPLVIDDGAADYDADRLFNYDEYFVHNTDPDVALDTDGDILADDWETVFGLDPLVSNGRYYYDDVALLDYVTDYRDTDSDGLHDLDEFLYGGDPLLVDTNGDGLADGPAWDAYADIGLETYQGGLDPGFGGFAAVSSFSASGHRSGSGGGTQARIPLWFTIGDWSPSESEIWSIDIAGPDGYSKTVKAPNRTDTIPFRVLLAPGQYDVSLDYGGTNATGEGSGDFEYDYRAIVRDNPSTDWGPGASTDLSGRGYSIANSGLITMRYNGSGGSRPNGIATLTVDPILLSNLFIADARDASRTLNQSVEAEGGNLYVPLELNGTGVIELVASIRLDDLPIGTRIPAEANRFTVKNRFGELVKEGAFSEDGVEFILPEGTSDTYTVEAWTDADGSLTINGDEKRIKAKVTTVGAERFLVGDTGLRSTKTAVQTYESDAQVIEIFYTLDAAAAPTIDFDLGAMIDGEEVDLLWRFETSEDTVASGSIRSNLTGLPKTVAAISKGKLDQLGGSVGGSFNLYFDADMDGETIESELISRVPVNFLPMSLTLTNPAFDETHSQISGTTLRSFHKRAIEYTFLNLLDSEFGDVFQLGGVTDAARRGANSPAVTYTASEGGDISYNPSLNIMSFPTSITGSIALHEGWHIYQDLVAGHNFDSELDERIGYTIEYIFNQFAASMQRFEDAVETLLTYDDASAVRAAFPTVAKAWDLAWRTAETAVIGNDAQVDPIPPGLPTDNVKLTSGDVQEAERLLGFNISASKYSLHMFELVESHMKDSGLTLTFRTNVGEEFLTETRTSGSTQMSAMLRLQQSPVFA